MEAIFSSKIYKTSRRKDKIASALQNPINTELVQQLKTYLDDPEVSQTAEPKNTPEPATEVITPSVANSPDVSTAPPTGRSSNSLPEQQSPAPSELSTVDQAPESVPSEPEEVPSEKTDDDEDKLPEQPDRQNTFHVPEKKASEEVTESTIVSAATVLYTPPVEASCCDKIRVDAAAIKGTLNIRDDTKGVSRIFVKDKELWIYYQDKVNLNSVMEPVIEVLNSTGFTNLEFNRLARTENAIVFEISCVYNDVQPMVKEEE